MDCFIPIYKHVVCPSLNPPVESEILNLKKLSKTDLNGLKTDWRIRVCFFQPSLQFRYMYLMAHQPTPPNVPPPEIAGLIKGILTICFP